MHPGARRLPVAPSASVAPSGGLFRPPLRSPDSNAATTGPVHSLRERQVPVTSRRTHCAPHPGRPFDPCVRPRSCIDHDRLQLDIPLVRTCPREPSMHGWRELRCLAHRGAGHSCALDTKADRAGSRQRIWRGWWRHILCHHALASGDQSGVKSHAAAPSVALRARSRKPKRTISMYASTKHPKRLRIHCERRRAPVARPASDSEHRIPTGFPRAHRRDVQSSEGARYLTQRVSLQ